MMRRWLTRCALVAFVVASGGFAGMVLEIVTR